MAIPLDKDRLLSDCRDEDLQSDMAGVEGICYERTIGYRYSDDKRYLIITKEQVIDLYAVNRLGKRDQYEQQALYIYGIFARYLDVMAKADFCQQLVEMLMAGVIEITTDCLGTTFINLPQGKGQAELIRLIVSHMTAQKQQAIHDSNHFNALKYLLIEHLRKQCSPITVNSMSVTLQRAITKD